MADIGRRVTGSWERRSCVVAGTRLAWAESGAGPPVIYLHDAGADTTTSALFDDLAADHRVMVLDLPGYGVSDAPAGIATAAAMAAVLGEFVATVSPGPVMVVGSSLGGWFAAELAVAFPALVAGLVLVDAAGLHAPHSYLFELFAQGAAAEATHHQVAEALVSRIDVSERPSATTSPKVAAALLAPWVQNLAGAAAMSWSPAVANPALLARLGRIRTPTIVLWGELDALIPLAHGRAFADAIAGAQLRIELGAGHLLVLERPDAVAKAVRSLSAAQAGSV